MDPDTEVESIFRQENYNKDEDDEEAKKRWMRPPSSYGSMKSDSDGMENEEEEEERLEEESADTVPPPIPVVLPGSSVHEGTGMQMDRSESPETLYTMTTQETKPPGALVIETGSEDLGDFLEDDNDEDMDEILVAHSPEPPEPIEPDDWMQTDEYGQPGRLHPEQDLPHIFRKKVKASCFPRPLTPKNKNVMSGPSSSHLQPALSPAERRQSMMFTIDNTPTNKNYLKKGLNKLRSSSRKSPGKTSKKSPAQTSARKCQENIPSGNPHSRVAQAGRNSSFKSPRVVPKGQKKSPRATSRTAKSPGLTASARKMMSRMKM